MARKITVDSGYFAKLVGITPRHVARLTEAGVLERARNDDGDELRGRYELAPNILAYCEYLRHQAKLDSSSETRWQTLRNEKMESESRISKLKLLVMEGKLHRGVDVEFSWTMILTRFKARALAIPSRLARVLVGETQFQVIYDRIMNEIEMLLRELASYNSKMFEGETESYLEGEGDENGEEAA